jgi:hypothetical protein
VCFCAHIDFRCCKPRVQGCQIFLVITYQKCTKLPQHYQMAIKYTQWP